jgi:mannose-1-phosphate guanylyltransferase
MIPAMVLAAGLGTRLRPLTEHRAKPLVPIGDRPALDHVVEPLRAAGLGPIVINAHHLAGEIAAYGAARGLAVSEERELLGTAGGVAAAAALLGPGDVLVWNGDILARIEVARLLQARGGEATLVVLPRPSGEGNVGVDAGGRVVRLRRETVAPGEVRGGDFLGVHVVGAALRATLPARGCLVGDVYLPAMRAGARLTIFDTREPFVDVGTLGAYFEANWAWLRERGASSFVDGSARVSERVTLASTIAGARSVITGEGRVERCVVWPDATLEAPASDVIATPFGVFR